MNGFLLIDKPAGMTSHDVVDRVRRVARTRAVGHAGTLDPFATGLLILGINGATKQLAQLVGLDKEYEATLMLGATSDTFDPEGKITTTVGAGLAPAQGRPQGSPLSDDIERALDQFRGGYDQKAPLHSAKKIGGKKLYELARAGKATEEMRPIKHVSISSLLVTCYSFPLLSLRVSCSSGTYIRSLADDIGRALGTGAYLTELRRTRIGSFSIDNAVALTDLNETSLQNQLKTALDSKAVN